MNPRFGAGRKETSMRLRLAMFVLLVVYTSFSAAASDSLPLSNWTVPQESGPVEGMIDASSGAIFFAMEPCRVVDTRKPDGPYGGPKLLGFRTFDIDNGPCFDIPFEPAAYSLSFGVTETTGNGAYLTAWAAGQPRPNVATITWNEGQTLTSAAIVPAGTAGEIAVYAASTTHLTIDINGYYLDQSVMNPGQALRLYADTPSTVLFIQNMNDTSTGDFTSGLAALMATPQAGPSSVLGAMTAPTSTHNHGVRGSNDGLEHGATGVLGNAGTAYWFTKVPANVGVRGMAAGGAASFGVIGEGTTAGVVGARTDSAGAIQTFAHVGGSGADGLYTPFNLSVAGTKSFVEPHPTTPGAVIKYVALEGPEAGTYFRGRSRIRGGFAVVDVPEHFRLASDEEGLTVQMTPIGQTAEIAVVQVDLDRVVLKGTRDIEFFYHVHGVRKAFRDFEPVQLAPAEQYFVPRSAEDRLDDYPMPEILRQRLIDNGTFHPDGTVNLETAERNGWTRQWEEAANRARHARPSVIAP